MPASVKVAKSSEIKPGTGRLVEVGGKRIAVFNVDGNFHAMDETCTHRGGPLSEGMLIGKEVTCPGTELSLT
jgi:nitrite reductase/ring-hydroxylating ferredoxin subunit